MQRDLLAFDLFELTIVAEYLPSSQLKKISTKKYQLPDVASFSKEKRFADVFMAWNDSTLMFYFDVTVSAQESFFPDFRRGDSIEVFIDTRDRKDKGFLSHFCHHFVFFPDKINQIQAREVTRFRGEDRHPLCKETDLTIKSEKKTKGYCLFATIPSYCLYGYDPERFDRMGFTYRINRYKQEPQHFSVSSHAYVIEYNPALWASINMEGKK